MEAVSPFPFIFCIFNHKRGVMSGSFLAIRYAQDECFPNSRADCPFLPPLVRMEHWYNILTKLLLVLSLALIGILPVPVAADILARRFLGFTFVGVTELETQALVFIAFAAMPYVTAPRANIVIDLLCGLFPKSVQDSLHLFVSVLCALIAGWLGFLTGGAAVETNALTLALYIPEKIPLAACTVGLALTSVGMVFHAFHSLRDLRGAGNMRGILSALAGAALIVALPLLYRTLEWDVSRLAIGGIGFLLLFILLFLRVPIGLGMSCMGILGLLVLFRSADSAWSLIAEIPYRETANFVLVAVPMFMLMGEITSVSGISRDMFDCFNKWLGRMPGGLACAAVSGCAGFGAICGDSMTTVITMSSVALPQMRAHRYDPGLAAGALAAGGTLGILIPPSMGFIFY